MRAPAEPAASILLVDHDRSAAQAIGQFLERRGHVVEYAGDGVSGLALAVSGAYDAIVMDVTLPGLGGLDVCRRLRREARDSSPVLMLGGGVDLEDKLDGFDAGADDYLARPFELRELEARLHALIRRNRRAVALELLRVGDLTLDTATLRVMRAGRVIELTPVGLKLLAILMRASPRIVSRAAIEREIWGDALPGTDTLRSHLYNLRCRIDKPFAHPLLHTLHTAGYRLVDLDAELAQLPPVDQAAGG